MPQCDGETAYEFIIDVARTVPPEQGAVLLANFKQFLEGNPSELGIWKSLIPLSQTIRKNGMNNLLERHIEMVMEKRFTAFIERVNKTGDGARRIVFVAHKPYFIILREALYLRRNGYHVFLVGLEPLPENLRAVFEKTFEHVVDANNSRKMLGRLLTLLKPDIFHVQSSMWVYWLGRLVMEHKGAAKVVCEFYDVTSVYAPREALCRVWNAPDVDFDLAMERTICLHADAVITRFPKPVHDELRERHGGLTKVIQFWPYPCSEFSSPAGRKPSEDDGIIRLVYTGCIIPSNEAHPREMFPSRGLLGPSRKLLEQGLHIDILVDPHRPLDPQDPDYGDYFRLVGQYPHFRIINGVSPDRLAERLAQYDFAYMIFDMNMDTIWNRPNQITYGLGTKLFGYMEANLPILLSADYEYQARLIEEHGLGIVVPNGHVGKVSEMIRAFDYKEALANIERFNVDYGMANQIGRLETLYSEICDCV